MRIDNTATQPLITATAQQSRFHAATFDAGANIDVELFNVTLTIGGLDVLEGANITLRNGVRYGLTGRNGCGKSSQSTRSHWLEGWSAIKLIMRSRAAGASRQAHTWHSPLAQDALGDTSGPRTSRGRHYRFAVCLGRPRRTKEGFGGAGRCVRETDSPTTCH